MTNDICSVKKWFSIQLKPVGSFCNLRCNYCYAKSYLAPKEIMNQEVLEAVIKKTINQEYLYPTFSWHGGEPTIVGYDFFESAMRLMEKYKKPNQIVYNLIQTNATLISPKIAKLFADYNFGVSVSVDGPEEIHGKNRKNINGNNSFKQVMQGIKNLRDNGINPSVICTVPKENLPYAEKVFKFLIDNGFTKIKYSPVFDPNENRFISCDEWFTYLKTVFHLWFDIGDPNIQIRDIDEVIVWLNGETLNLCSSNMNCLNWVSIDPHGNIYPCEYLKVDYRFGNILDQSLEDISSNESYLEFEQMVKAIPPKCQKCEFYKLCGNGCPNTRVLHDEISFKGVYAFCEERKMLFSEIKNTFDIFIS